MELRLPWTSRFSSAGILHPWALQVAQLSGLGSQYPRFAKFLDPQVSTDQEEEGKPEVGYMGLTANTFKVKYGNHKTSFEHSKRKNQHQPRWACVARQGWQ